LAWKKTNYFMTSRRIGRRDLEARRGTGISSSLAGSRPSRGSKADFVMKMPVSISSPKFLVPVRSISSM